MKSSALAGAVLLVMWGAACRQSSTVDKGGPATGDEVQRVAGDSAGVGSAASNDSLQEQRPGGRSRGPAHDETGHETGARSQ